MSDFCYDVDRIAEDCFDGYISDDGGYTWEYFSTYINEHEAIDDLAHWKSLAEANYISHGK